ncbi:cyclic peptide export ABC transporter [Shumkonia mesophila]|uniref:cyclic peptide export ABC transporter n=1 Tax=Shumkonia mesophila TaxID=2838854 RepID=UPI002934DFAE|nr:cyclic peptide export ABC transporter [Shumkonia mesophila]
MYLLRLLETDTRNAYRGIIVLTVLAGVGNAGLIGLINQAAEKAALSETVSLRDLILYVLVFAFYYVANRASLKESNRFLQERLSFLRLRVVGKIRSAPLRTLEGIGHGQLFAAVAQEMNHLSQNLPLFAAAAQGGFLLLFCLFYIATLSVPSFLLIAAFTIVGLFIFWRRRIALNKALEEVYAHEAAMLDSMANFTEGFQEIRLNAAKNDSLFARFSEIVSELERAVVGVGGRWVMLLQFSNIFLYALLGLVILVLPMFFEGATDTIYKIAAAALFCIGPVTAITAVSHLYARAAVGLGHVYRLEEALDRAEPPPQPPVETPGFAGFKRIDLESIRFSYLDPQGQALFTSGPWDFTLHRGETVFLTGGNGSGKSTMMKVLCGLYTPGEGRILVDGDPVTEASRQAYREIFTAIFPDFHLFDRLHGLGEVDPAAVTKQIEWMELGGKVTFADGRFSTLELSTGQRKRLAMVVSLLEDRDIYLFDEWAADQDAHFREIFYTEILAELKRRGKTVLAVTHDERYWSHCDRRLVMDLGTVRPAGEG